MANLSETETYEAAIYQLETSDKLMGGAEGISNRQASQLANRTAWLKANRLAASQGTFTAALRMHSDPTNTTGTNVTAQATGSYVRIGDMVWITLEMTVTQYNHHVLKYITGLPFPAAKKSVLGVGDSRGIFRRWARGSGIADRLAATVGAGTVRITLIAIGDGLWAPFWGTPNDATKTKVFEISGWYQAGAGA